MKTKEREKWLILVVRITNSGTMEMEEENIFANLVFQSNLRSRKHIQLEASDNFHKCNKSR